jgi:hypothetical protein
MAELRQRGFRVVPFPLTPQQRSASPKERAQIQELTGGCRTGTAGIRAPSVWNSPGRSFLFRIISSSQWSNHDYRSNA